MNTIQCTVLQKRKNVAVVRYRDSSGNLQATIIPIENVARVGISNSNSVAVPEHVVLSGTEYGIDWTILMDSYCITPEEVQQVMRSHGIWTDDDFKNKSVDRTAALLSLVNKISGRMLQIIREEL